MQLKVLKYLCCSIFLLLLIGELSAQQLSGTIKNAKGKKVRLSFVDDFVSQREIKMDETIVDANDCFAFNIVANQVKLVIITIDYSRAEIIVEPGKKYLLRFQDYPDNVDESKNPFFDTQLKLTYQLMDADSTSLNVMINELNYILDTFSAKNFNAVYKAKNYKSIDSLKSFLDRKYSYSDNTYFLNYKKYRMAEFDELMQKSRQRIFDECFYEKPILVNNIAYMAFLESFYDKYFPIGVKYNYFVFIDQLNKGGRLNNILDSLGRDTMLKNEVFRELVFLLGMKTMLHNELIEDPASILSLLDELSRETKFPENKKIAQNLVYIYHAERPVGLPDFKWIDTDSTTYTKQNFDHKYLYIMLVKSNCRTCPAEFNVLKKIKEKTDTTKIDFVVLNTDYNFAQYYHQAKDLKSDLKCYYFNGNVEWLEQLGIVTFPNAVLVSSQGEIMLNIGLPSIFETHKQLMNNIKK